MITTLQHWPGAVEINGVYYNSIQEVPQIHPEEFLQPISIKLFPRQKVSETTNSKDKEYRITVKQYMTKRATLEFDFMAKWNKDIPMPLRTMIGTKEKETRGMVYMKLHGDIYADRVTCMKCGRTLTNPVSQWFGIGPECGGHNYIHPFNTDAELKAAVEEYRKELQNVTWEGWIIKSAITEEVEL